MRCPICEKEFAIEESPAPPFCSDRCRRIDLGRWLKGQYAVPAEEAPDPELGPGTEHGEGR